MHVKTHLGLGPTNVITSLDLYIGLIGKRKKEGVGLMGGGGGKKVLGSQNFENRFLGSQYKKV